MSADVKLLVLHSNCVHMRTHVLKDLTARCLPLPAIATSAIQGLSQKSQCLISHEDVTNLWYQRVARKINFNQMTDEGVKEATV